MLEALECRLVPDATTFVQNLYQDVLGRAGSSAEVALWVAALQNGTSAEDVAAGFWDSAEHRALQTATYYQNYLQRSAGADEVAAWVSRFLAGSSSTDVQLGFLTSQEFTNAHATDAAFVAGLYSDVLGRTGSAAEAAAWLGALQGGVSRAAVARGVLTSAEFARAQAADDYSTFLNRTASAAELSLWAAAVGGGATLDAMAITCLASPEYQMLAGGNVVTPAIGVTGFSAAEGNSGTTTADFVVNLSEASTSTVTVQYATADGSATAGSDYVATSGTLTFAPGVTSLDVPVTILGDTAVEGNETLMLNLSNPTNATLSIASAAGTIVDDDGSTTAPTLTPAVTQGPYFQDFSDSSLNRSDVTEGQAGTTLTLTFHVYQVSGTTVTPLAGARVDIWSANALGVYSDEAVEGTAGQTYLRGYQYTDSTGTVTFTTIIPGWYAGRTPHIHFMVRSTSSSGTLTNRMTSQLFFDQSFINTLYTTTAPYNTRGLADTTNAADMVYNTTTASGTAAGPSLLLGLTQTSSGYAGTYNVYVAAT
jgi:protocatechuate 3,4-dioxygenase beta subunit